MRPSGHSVVKTADTYDAHVGARMSGNDVLRTFRAVSSAISYKYGQIHKEFGREKALREVGGFVRLLTFMRDLNAAHLPATTLNIDLATVTCQKNGLDEDKTCLVLVLLFGERVVDRVVFSA
jgi:hypothetical protein